MEMPRFSVILLVISLSASSAPWSHGQAPLRTAAEFDPDARAVDMMYERWDADADGMLTGAEMPERFRERFGNADSNGDNKVSRDEMIAFRRQVRVRQGIESGPPRGFQGEPMNRSNGGMEAPSRSRFERESAVRPGAGDAGARMDDRLADAGIRLGMPFPALTFHDAAGRAITSEEVLNAKHTVFVFGCLTCPVFHRTYQEVEAVYEDYRSKDVQFFYIYKSLAHPENFGYVTPLTLEERLKHVKEAQGALDTRIPWLCDSMANDAKHALGGAPNSEFLVNPEGAIVYFSSWSDGKALRNALESEVGAVEEPTTAVMLDRKMDFSAVEFAPTGVVPRRQRPGRLTGLQINPVPGKDGNPFYVKLRAETDDRLLSDGKGILYLGFFPDPIYRVYWNNLVDPLRFELELPDGIDITPSSGVGPKVEAQSDRDPREFLLRVAASDIREPIGLSITYYACTEEWCRPFTQRYQISLERDPDEGWVISRPPRGGGRDGQGPRRGRGDPAQFIARMLENDTNGDGKISVDEAPERMQDRFDMMDANSDGFLEKAELEAMTQRFNRRRPPLPPPRFMLENN